MTEPSAVEVWEQLRGAVALPVTTYTLAHPTLVTLVAEHDSFARIIKNITREHMEARAETTRLRGALEELADAAFDADLDTDGAQYISQLGRLNAAINAARAALPEGAER